MAKDVLITPASGKVEWKDSGNLQASIYELGGDLYLNSESGSLILGDGAPTNVEIGNATVAVSFSFLGGGTITSNSNTLNIGASGDTINLNVSGVTYNYANNIVTTADYTAADVLTKIKTVDGAGSGLDADLLDGYSTATTASANTIAVRDSNGNIIASAFTYANGVSILSDLYANAGAQAGSIATLTANAAAQAGDIATLFANAGAQAGSIASLTSNAAVQAGDIATLFANAGAQSGAIVTANTAMKGYVDGQISTVNSNWQANAGAQAGDIATLYANAGAQSGSIATILANLGSVSGSLSTLTSNAAAQAGDIATLYANAGAQAGSIATLTSNAAVQAGDIATLFANAGAQSGSIATLTSNAAAQAGSITDLYTIKANILNPTFTNNVTVQGNLIISGNLFTTNVDNLQIDDSMIYMAENNATDFLDIGIVGSITKDSLYQHVGLVRDATDSYWKFFANVQPEPTTVIDFGSATYGSVLAGNIVAAGNIVVGANLRLTGALLNSAGLPGTNGQYLTSTGNGIAWTTIDVAADNITNGNTNVTANPTSVNVTVSGTEVMNIDSSGVATVNGTLYVQSSESLAWPNYSQQLAVYENLSNITAIGINTTTSTVLLVNDDDKFRIENNSGPMITADSANVTIPLTTPSTSTTTGALRVAGGAGIAGNINAGGTTHIISGNVGIGTISPVSPRSMGGGIYGPPKLAIEYGDSFYTTLSLVNYNNSGTSVLSLAKSRGGSTVGTLGTTNSGDLLGGISFEGINSNGTPSIQYAAFISGVQDGAATTTKIPGRLVFSTSDGIVDPVERMRISNNGNVSISTTTTSTSTTTGALIVSGGVGVAGNITAGGNVVVAHQLRVNSGNFTTAIVNSGTAGVGNIGASGAGFNTVFARATSAQYADLAEIYTSDREYVPGTVLIFGGEREVTVSTLSHDPRVAGVVSTNPAYIMNNSCDGVEVALQGRVPTKVQGPVTKGDRLVTSSVQGAAERLDMSKYQPGCIIGKALEDIADNSIQTIEVVIGRV